MDLSLLDDLFRLIFMIVVAYFVGVFYSYINRLRVLAACEILNRKESKKLSLEGIANQVGFKSKSSFNQHFKTVTGKKPSEFRKQINP